MLNSIKIKNDEDLEESFGSYRTGHSKKISLNPVLYLSSSLSRKLQLLASDKYLLKLLRRWK
jgi:hypothetical protein